jgi:hypothetical protein
MSRTSAVRSGSASAIGWNHLQRLQALALLYQDRKRSEGWPAERLVPMLAGMLELLPWVKQWHNDPDPAYDGLRLGDYFEGFVKGQCDELGVSLDDVRGWRPGHAHGPPRQGVDHAQHPRRIVSLRPAALMTRGRVPRTCRQARDRRIPFSDGLTSSSATGYFGPSFYFDDQR